MLMIILSGDTTQQDIHSLVKLSYHDSWLESSLSDFVEPSTTNVLWSETDVGTVFNGLYSQKYK